MVAGMGFEPHDLRVILRGVRASRSAEELRFATRLLYHRTKSTKFLLGALMVAGMGFEPHDLRVMSPMSYQTALPRDITY